MEMKPYLTILRFFLITVIIYLGVDLFYQVLTARLDNAFISTAMQKQVSAAGDKASRSLAYYQAIARRAHRKPVAQALPKALSRLIRLAPRVERLAPFPLAPADLFDSMVFYNCKNTLTHLAGTRLHCPPFESYVERLVRYINETDELRRVRAEEQLADPLA